MAIYSKYFQTNLEGRAFDKIQEQCKPLMETAVLSAKALLVKRVLAEGFGARYTSKPYINYRLRRGRPVDFVNLSMSGKMFQGWNIPQSEIKGTIVYAGVKGGDSETNLKLQVNSQRYDDFPLLNQAELEMIATQYIRPQLTDIIKKAFLS